MPSDNFELVRIRVQPENYKEKLRRLMEVHQTKSMTVMLEILIDMGIEALDEVRTAEDTK